jgi:hypothetical protein
VIFAMATAVHDEGYARFLSILCHHHGIQPVAVIIVKTVEGSADYNTLPSPKHEFSSEV